nr:fimbria/pilus periplasmic chaperone [Leclercia sp. LTM01]
MFKKIISNTALMLVLSTCTAYAGTQIGATRVIYTEGKKEASVNITNKDASPYLIKSWIENSNLSGSHFIVTPPLFRMMVIKKMSFAFSKRIINFLLTGKVCSF